MAEGQGRRFTERFTRSFPSLPFHRVNVSPVAVKSKEAKTRKGTLKEELNHELACATDCFSIEGLCEIINGRLTKLVKHLDYCGNGSKDNNESQRNFMGDLEVLSELLNRRHVYISAIGQQNVGKSTLLNGTMGDMYLPQMGTSETSVKVRIDHDQAVHEGYCPGKECVFKVSRAHGNMEKTECPKLIVIMNDTPTISATGCKDILTELKKLNKQCREETCVQQKEVEVILAVHIPLLAKCVDSGWIVSLVDNPGYGESNEFVQQVAETAIMTSAAYMLVTCTNTMDSKPTCDFLKKLAEEDKDAFGDDRVIVGITQFDNNYQVPFGEESITEPEARAKMCKIVHDACHGSKMEPDSVIPIVGSWALYSCMLRNVSEVQHPKEFQERKQVVVRCLNNFPQATASFSQGQGENTPLTDVEPEKLAKMLHDASHIGGFLERLQVIVTKCVHTWRQKVCSSYCRLTNEARNYLIQKCGILDAELKRGRSDLHVRKERYESIQRELQEIKETTDYKKKPEILTSIEAAFEVDIQSQLQNLEQCACLVLEENISGFETKCEEKINSQTGLTRDQFKQDFDEFLKSCESALEDELNRTCMFRTVSSAITEHSAKIGERIGVLRKEACDLCKKAYSRTTLPASGTRHMASAHQKPKPLKPPSLGDLKDAADTIPEFRLSALDHFLNFIRTILNLGPQRQGQPIDYLRLDDLRQIFQSLQSMLWEQCQSHFQSLKSPAITHFYSVDYRPLVLKLICGFQADFDAALKEELEKQMKISEELSRKKEEAIGLMDSSEHLQDLETHLYKLRDQYEN